VPKAKIPTANIEEARIMLEALFERQHLPPILPKILSITFGGTLGDRFCKSFDWHRNGLTDQVPDAIKAIAVNYSGLQSYLYECDRNGQLFAVSIDGEWCADDLSFASYLGDAKAIHIEPLPSGAGTGNIIKGILGAAILGVGIFASAGSFAVLGIAGKSLIMAGGSMVLSGLAGALFNRPMIKKNEEGEGDKRKSSYFSSSSQNAAGAIIPRLYGSSVDEIGGVAYAIGRRVPVNVLSFIIDYVEVEEAEPDD